MLRGHGVKEKIRREGPKTHYTKEGTPTMGGIIILAAIIIPTLLWADLSNRFIQLILFVTIWMGAIGFMDDYMKAILKHPKGMVGKYKLVGQIVCGLILGFNLYYYAPSPSFGTTTEIPFIKSRLSKIMF
jgi:phospho-N-acetylmuramoyl-pentapeptide-transferase